MVVDVTGAGVWMRQGTWVRRMVAVAATVALMVALMVLPAAPAFAASTYTVRRGDTLARVAHQLGTSVAALAVANGIRDPDQIRVGQVLRVPSGAAATTPGSPYAGLGTWVDVYDFLPAFQRPGHPPPLTPASVDRMAASGIRTLYLQAAIDSPRAAGALVDQARVDAFVRRAHERGMQVVGWYLPRFAAVDRDLSHLQALAGFRAGGRGFDGLAVDIEWTAAVPDVRRRNAAVVALLARLRSMTTLPVGAVVLPPVLLEVVNARYWPSFPWRPAAPYVDVWLPMSYWTERTLASGYRDARRYTDENVRRLRANLGDARAPVHVIGGVGGGSGADQYVGFARAAAAHGAVGLSVYDFRATGAGVWPLLRRAWG
jgi:LysM domain